MPPSHAIGPVLETARLLLRVPEAGDFEGYAAEAATASIDWAFDALGWSEVIHSIAPANTPSQRLAAHLGSRNRGPGRLPPPYAEAPVDIWGQSRDEWRARRMAGR